MTRPIFHLQEARAQLPISVMLGVGFAVALFALMALAQMIGDARPPQRGIDETLLAFNPPDIDVLVEPPAPPEEEPPPELEEEPPQLSLDQLDIALNPGTGGSLAGDFALPGFAVETASLGDEFVDFSNLDQTPRPVGVSGLDFPARLRKKKVSGKVVLLLKLSHEGKVLDVQVDSSTLPEFDDFVAGEVRRWKFTPPTQAGRPVNAEARLPIPITIN
jgi:protein TonB